MYQLHVWLQHRLLFAEKLNTKLTLSDHLAPEIMSLAGSYSSAKRAFLGGQYRECSKKLRSVLEGDIGFDQQAVLKANLFVAGLLQSGQPLNEGEALDTLALLKGILRREVRVNAITVFCRNVALYQISRGKYQSAFKFVEAIQANVPGGDTSKLVAAIFLSQKDVTFDDSSSFARMWKSYFLRDGHTILQVANEKERYVPFLRGVAFFGMKKWDEALAAFRESIELKFRLEDSLNYAGICSFYMKQMKDSVEFFEKAIRCSHVGTAAIFNLAEVCGFLGRSYEQQTLLQFYARMEKAQNKGSLSTLYLLARMSMKDRDWRTAVDRYQFIMDEAKANGMDLPSSSFVIEFAHALNQIGDLPGAVEILNGITPDSVQAKEVIAHTLYLERKYSECRDMISSLKTPEATANKAILEFMSGEEMEAMKLITEARKAAPGNLAITKIAALFMFAKQFSAKGGAAIWLTACGYQLNHQPEYYDELLQTYRYGGVCDPVTVASLEFWRNHVNG